MGNQQVFFPAPIPPLFAKDARGAGTYHHICQSREVTDIIDWSEKRDLNPQHPTWKDGALPVELFPRMVPRDGLEPPTLSV